MHTFRKRSSVLLLTLLGGVALVEGAKFNPMETLFQQPRPPRPSSNTQQQQQQQQQPPQDGVSENATFQQEQAKPKQFIPPRTDPFAPTPEEREAERLARRERNRQRHAKIQEAMRKVSPPQPTTSSSAAAGGGGGGVERLSASEFQALQQDHPEFRKLWGGGGNSQHMIEYADPGDDYDMWQQAYRMLGGFIDCDHQKSEGSGDNNNNNNNNGGDNGGACSRWMMWASVSCYGDG